jgi:hypothetical protein
MSAPTRRGLFSATALLLAADCIGAGALAGAVTEHARDGQCAHPDADLLEACAEYHRCYDAAHDKADLSEEEWEEIDDAWDEAMDLVSDLKAQTLEGIRAKAGVAARQLTWRVKSMTEMTWEEQADPAERMAIDTLNEIAGRA